MADPRKVPIDIQYRKLLEGLIDRKIVLVQWTEQHQQIRDGLAILYPDLPSSTDKLTKLRVKKLSHEELTYFDCKYIMECLQESPEGANKNFFGQYTSPVLKKWQALLRMYEKNNVFAAEAARLITQNTAFEIPFLKKTMVQNEKLVADNKRKIMDLTKSIAEFKRKLETSCADMGIAGVHFREELQRLPLELPSLFADVAKVICSDDVDAAIEYHTAMQTYLHNCDVPVIATVGTGGSGKKDKGKKSSPAATIQSEEDYVPFDFFTAIKELRTASEAFDSPRSFDFEAEAADIDWDISLADTSSADGATIDWGIETLSEDPTTTVTSDDNAVDLDVPVEIDWDITTDVIEPVEVADVSAIDGSAPVVIETVVDASSRVGLLSDNEFRSRVLNELLELKAFLGQRRQELADNTNVAFANQFQGTSPLLEHQSEEKVKTYQQAVDQAISQLTNKRLQQLVLIKSSDRYLDRHVAALEMLTKHMDKCEREIHAIEDRNMDLVDATSRLQPQIDGLVASTKKLKKELEAALPPLFKGYRVNIVGDVNSL
ncbi:hypothetical protein Poli38472_004298 [Pythium oligandrum]|uniref:CDK5RAP3-like protein n=1 Tax=Pythium oligandrum TaxID=41045 RepID=A0A8K1CQJ1_PYTOL|nr:hypothetical protein Poli38472_004298 [Pythium oligandrum]|eukprot:TMW66533.1 hypothetical protein Poli38472_004298 [Pythium oligandrum]